MGKQAPLVNLPCLKLEDGQIISCTTAIVRYLARKYKLMGKDDNQEVMVDMCLDVLHDFTDAWFKAVMMNKTESAPVQMFNQTYGVRFLSPLEAVLAKNGPYFCGDEITVADVSFLSTATNVIRWKPTFLEEFPNLKALYELLLAHSELGTQAKKRRRYAGHPPIYIHSGQAS